MPFLEIGETKSLDQRFNFLNISATVPAEEARIEDKKPKPVLETLRTSLQNSTQAAQTDGFFAHEALTQVCVVKTTIDGEKLFINLLRPSSMAVEDRDLILFSDIGTDTDKTGQQCYVVTSLICSTSLSRDSNEEILAMLDLLQKTLQVTIGQSYTIPKMKKKGHWGQIRVPTLQEVASANAVDGADRKRLIIETEESVTDTTKPAGSSPLVESHKRKISKRSVSLLASPLPTMYTHHLSIMLHSGTPTAVKRSWSVYYDSQDSTLKVLIPPKEEFETIAVRTDDFRAFTKDEHLHIFYIGK